MPPKPQRKGGIIFVIRNLASGQARYLLGLLITAGGVGYIPLGFVDPETYTTSYRVQADIMPIWLYCIVQLSIGISLILSANANIRLSIIGRTISVLAFTLTVLFFCYLDAIICMDCYHNIYCDGCNHVDASRIHTASGVSCVDS